MLLTTYTQNVRVDFSHIPNDTACLLSDQTTMPKIDKRTPTQLQQSTLTKKSIHIFEELLQHNTKQQNQEQKYPTHEFHATRPTENIRI